LPADQGGRRRAYETSVLRRAIASRLRIIQHAIWLYLRFALSFRDFEELLAERGIDVSYETIRRWVAVFGRAAGLNRGNQAPAMFESVLYTVVLHQSFGYGGRIQMAGSGDRD
jgi:hypothetical protein